MQADDRPVVVGFGGDEGELFVLRLTSAGLPDADFTDDGFEFYDLAAGIDGSAGYAVLVQAIDQKIVVAGRAAQASAILRLEPSGVPDPGFGTDGVWTDSTGDTEALFDLQLDGLGRIVASGGVDTFASGDADFLAYRVSPSGVGDPSFGGTGAVVVEFELVADGVDGHGAAAVLHAGKLVLGGAAESGVGESTGVVARLGIDLVFADGFETGSTGAWSVVAP
jgi:uncharacterized delta-60 repeat protein